MHLHHLHLPHLTPYLHASHLQSLLVRQHLSFLAKTAPPPPSLPNTTSSPSPFQSHLTPPPSRPPPYLLTFTPLPTYTTGRRDLPLLCASQIAHLTAPTPSGRASFQPSLRGGQTTFHGPGQVVAYLVAYLPRHGLDTRSHVWLLEEAVIKTLAFYGLVGVRSAEYPGVWVAGSGASSGVGLVGGGGEKGKEKKIASVGVRLRRHVSSYGIALNVATDLGWFERIVACGLPGDRVTSMERLGVRVGGGVEEVVGVFEGVVAGLLGGVEGVRRVEEGEVLALAEEGDKGMGEEG